MNLSIARIKILRLKLNNDLEDLKSQPWFIPNLKRKEAENNLLLSRNRDGSFLIRKSKNADGYTLSVRTRNKVIHHRIQEWEHCENCSNILYGFHKWRRFRSLQELVKYYSKHGVLDYFMDFIRLRQPCIMVKNSDVKNLLNQTKPMSDKWGIDRSSLRFIRKIGKGSFGEVWEGVCSDTIPVAIKKLIPHAMDRKEFLTEGEIMKKLYHKNLIKLHGVCTVKEPIFIVTELMPNGSLLQYLQGKGKWMNFQQLIYMAAQIACGMAYLESKNFIHRDLAARNVLVGEKYKVKIADFGLARLIKDEIYFGRKGAPFPIRWTAPDAANHRQFSIKSDVWSFGILLTEIITYGRVPYPDMDNKEILDKVERGYRMPKPKGCPPLLYDLMLDCWNHIPMRRPTFKALQWDLENWQCQY